MAYFIVAISHANLNIFGWPAKPADKLINYNLSS